MRKAATVFGGFLVAAIAFAQVPESLPVNTLSGRSLVVPADLPASPYLLIVGFSRSSKAQTSAWSRRVASDPHLTELSRFQVAILEDVPSFFRGFVVRSIKDGVPDSMRDRFWVVTEKAGAWKLLMAYSGQDSAYVALLDAAHQVIWRSEGEVTEAALKALQTKLQSLRVGR